MSPGSPGPQGPASANRPDQTFVLRPSPPIRGLAISAVAMLVGVLVLVAATEFGWPAALSWLGLGLAVAGAAVGVAALVSARRLRSEVTVRPGGLTVSGVRGRTTVPWSEIERVTAIDEQLILVRTEGRPEVLVINPRGRREPAYPSLLVAIRDGMDADRGYRPL